MGAILIYDTSGHLLSKSGEVVECAQAIEESGCIESISSEGSWLSRDIWSALQSQNHPEEWSFSFGGPRADEFTAHVMAVETRAQNSARMYIFQLNWIGKQHRAEEHFRLEILQLARLASLGSLGGPLAHALNNPLATIRGFADVLKRRFSQIDKVAYFSEKIVANADRMKGTIDQLRRLSQPAAFDQTQAFDLHEVLRSSVGVLEEQFKMRNIETELRLADQDCLVQGDSTMWESLFLALLSLTRDTFAQRNDDSKKKIVLVVKSYDEGVTITYQDTAGGLPHITSENVRNPMEILSRTNSTGRMASFVVSEVLRMHNAQLEMDTSDPESTALTIWIPTQGIDGSQLTKNGEGQEPSPQGRAAG
jgi:signal transduction histidine kinase